jgi:hypothetical protein
MGRLVAPSSDQKAKVTPFGIVRNISKSLKSLGRTFLTSLNFTPSWKSCESHSQRSLTGRECCNDCFRCSRNLIPVINHREHLVSRLCQHRRLHSLHIRKSTFSNHFLVPLEPRHRPDTSTCRGKTSKIQKGGRKCSSAGGRTAVVNGVCGVSGLGCVSPSPLFEDRVLMKVIRRLIRTNTFKLLHNSAIHLFTTHLACSTRWQAITSRYRHVFSSYLPPHTAR